MVLRICGAELVGAAPAVELETGLGTAFCPAACVTQTLEIAINNAATRPLTKTDAGNRQPEIMYNLFRGLSDLPREALSVFELLRAQTMETVRQSHHAKP